MNAMPKKGEWGAAVVRIAAILIASAIVAGAGWAKAVSDEHITFRAELSAIRASLCRIEKRQDKQPTSDCASGTR